MSRDAHDAPGLAAAWLNGWLAAVGITVLVEQARLAWTNEPLPIARISFPGDLVEAVSVALPSVGFIDNLSIARHRSDKARDMGRVVTRDVFRERAALARLHGDLSLERTVTDLAQEENGLVHGPLDPPMPRGVTIHERLRGLRLAMEGADLATEVGHSLDGKGRRIRANGLGFDHRRFPAGANPETQPFVDPVVEILAFEGMSLLPVRGTGTGPKERQRGWTKPVSHRGALTWPTWSAPLDRWGIDAMLDRFWTLNTCRIVKPGREQQRLAQDRLGAQRWGITGAFASVYRQPKSTNDTGRGYASERIW